MLNFNTAFSFLNCSSPLSSSLFTCSTHLICSHIQTASLAVPYSISLICSQVSPNLQWRIQSGVSGECKHQNRTFLPCTAIDIRNITNLFFGGGSEGGMTWLPSPGSALASPPHSPSHRWLWSSSSGAAPGRSGTTRGRSRSAPPPETSAPRWWRPPCASPCTAPPRTDSHAAYIRVRKVTTDRHIRNR